mmetsp:Transcript_567/g.571  ORF Transcript_567/g.571 Transcript_567/m.571 type:complete len:102 (+) Transcript_567:17-322(+)
MPRESVVFAEIRDDVKDIVDKVVADKLEGRTYTASDAQSWTSIISKDIVTELQEFNSNFKYTVMCLIMKKSDAGLHISNSCYWNGTTDGNLPHKWENDSMH